MRTPKIIYKTYIPEVYSDKEGSIGLTEGIKRMFRDISNYQARKIKRHFKLKNNKFYCLIKYACVYEDNKLVVVVDNDTIYIQFDALIDTIGKKVVYEIQQNYNRWNSEFGKPRTLPVVFVDNLEELFGTNVFAFKSLQEKKDLEQKLLDLLND